MKALVRGNMKKRYLYSLFFGLPGLFIAGIISILLLGGFAGFLWLFAFGDRPWPPFSETILSVLFVLVVSVLWIASILLGYRVGKRLETDPRLHRSHVLLSAGLTVLFILLMVLHQFSVGNLGPKSDSLLCSDFCATHRYSGSGMPPEISGGRTCSCYDSVGNEVLTVPLDIIATRVPK